MKIIIKPNKKQRAKKVEDYNSQSFILEAREILMMIVDDGCYASGSQFTDCLGVAQPQVNEENPLRYFVLNPKHEDMVKTYGGIIVVNPKLLQTDPKTETESPEASLSYPHNRKKKIKRFLSIESSYDILTSVKREDDGKYNAEIKKGKVVALTGMAAIFFQHQLDCLNGIYIY